MRRLVGTVLLLCLVLVVLLLGGCGAADAPPPSRTPQERLEDSTGAVAALRDSKFDQAGRAATAALALDRNNARAAAVHAISTYRRAGHELLVELETITRSGVSAKAFDHERGRAMWSTFLARLEDVQRSLAVVAKDPDFSLELCLACWEHDWNRNGEIDDNDRRMFQIEVDGDGNELAETDPRRRPTYRFDVGDAEWALAMIAFQRATVELVLAYKWSELDKLFGVDSDKTKLTLRLHDRSRVRRARELVLAGVAHADRCRSLYLAETDDDREWVPNPRQTSYAMPLEVDTALYETWHAVLGDVRRMLESKEGISLREVVRFVAGDPESRYMPDAYIDLGAMLQRPRDIVLDFAKLDDAKRQIEPILKDVLGAGYRKHMKPSPIVSRLRRMRDELSRGEDTFERKLRYLLWLN